MLVINFRVLAEALADAAKFVDTDSALKILQRIRLTTVEKTLILRATDLETAYERRLNDTFGDDASFAGSIPPKALSSLPFDRNTVIQLSVKGADTVFSDPDASVEVPPPEGDLADFDNIGLFRVDPENGLHESPIVTFDPAAAIRFVRALTFVLPAAATEDNRPILTGVHLSYGSGSITLETADGYRTHCATFEAETEESGDLIIPAQSLRKWLSVVDPTNGLTLKRRHGRETGLVIETPQDRWAALVIEGRYPNIASLFPETYAHTATFQASGWVAPLKKLKTFRPHTEFIPWAVEFPLEWRADEVLFLQGSAISELDVRLSLKLPATWTYSALPRLRICLHAQQVLEALSGFINAAGKRDLAVALHIRDEQSPLLFDIAPEDGLTLEALVMPGRFNG